MGRFLETLKSLGWTGTILLTVVGGIWVAATYFNEQRLAYSRTFSEKQLDVTYKVTDVITSLVTEATEEQWEKDKTLFWKLYLGDLVLFESDDTAASMAEFGNALEQTEFADRFRLRPYAMHVSKSLRNFIADRNRNDWRITFDTLKGF